MVDETGQIMKEAGAAGDAVLSNLGLSRELIGLEACSSTAWLDGESKATGWPAICIELRQAKGAMGATPNKIDRNDARAIAQSCEPAGSAQ